jgi:hypothetical protein
MVVRTRFLMSAAVACCLALSGGAVPLAQQKNEKPQERKRPKITIKANPTMGRAPLRIVFSAELVGGSDDYEDYYCPTVLWEWGRGNTSEQTSDCPPYEPGKSQIKRRYTTEHTFRNFGNFRVYFTLIHRDKEIDNASINIAVQPGGSGTPDWDSP